jgi:hypothetical protein
MEAFGQLLPARRFQSSNAAHGLEQLQGTNAFPRRLYACTSIILPSPRFVSLIVKGRLLMCVPFAS